MKKLLHCTIVCILFTCTTEAQITKGSLLIGGNFNLGARETENGGTSNFISKYKGLTFNPSIGIAWSQNTIVGFGLTYGKSTSKTNNQSIYKFDLYGINIFLRKYLPLGKSFYLFGEGAAYYTYSNEEEKLNTILTRVNKTRNIGISFYPGIAYAVSRRFHLEAGINNLININYSNQNIIDYSSPINKSTSKSINFNLNASPATPLQVGFRFLLTK